MATSKKAALPSLFDAVLYTVLLVAAIGVGVYIYVNLAGGAGGQVSELFKLVEAPPKLTVGIAGEGRKCASAYECADGLTCLSGTCVAYESQQQLNILGKDWCDHSWDNHAEDALGGVTNSEKNPTYTQCVPAQKGYYVVEVDPKSKVYIDSGNPKRTGRAEAHIYYIEQNKKLLNEEIQEPDLVEAPPNKYYIDSITSRTDGIYICGWYGDTTCNDNSGSILVRLDKIPDSLLTNNPATA